MKEFRIGLATGTVVFLYGVIGFGMATLAARRSDHPLATAWLELMGGK